MPRDLIFVDTSYIYATINPRDQWHSDAINIRDQIVTRNAQLITTEFILVEIADGLSTEVFRKAAARAIRLIQADPNVEIVPLSSNLMNRALDLFEARADKNWGLTDCTSFVVMKERDISEALTTDEHFRQAGFTTLLLDQNKY